VESHSKQFIGRGFMGDAWVPDERDASGDA